MSQPPPITKEQLALFRDPRWRLRNLYSIRCADGTVKPFRPNSEQEKVMEAFYV